MFVATALQRRACEGVLRSHPGIVTAFFLPVAEALSAATAAAYSAAGGADPAAGAAAACPALVCPLVLNFLTAAAAVAGTLVRAHRHWRSPVTALTPVAGAFALTQLWSALEAGAAAAPCPAALADYDWVTPDTVAGPVATVAPWPAIAVGMWRALYWRASAA